ncbi:M23 family metallopeptidase [Haloimpatiens lingqiaonensis]|uniref:M23 family metallopeptidase n=1 Tax=Haloimpatiens lingqiaonensis TaxID=1380675 RepID=UPI0010FE2C8D|nr:M23 family metallopeptidase [Haloimpatiens lingqiaonensis]
MLNDKNNGNSPRKLRKEALYVILFVCLCVVATVAAVTSRNNKLAKKQQVENAKMQSQKPTDNEKNPQITLVDDSLREQQQYENSLEVKNNKNKNTNAKEEKKEVKVSGNVSNCKMIKPVDGSMGREYSEAPVYWESSGTYKPNFGMDIKAELGKKVVAVSDGIVVEVGDNREGYGKQVVIDHQNGLKSVYANLSKDISVKKGQKVKQGETVGEVGNTSLNSYGEKYGSNLHFEILKGNEKINPAKYVKY